MQNITLLQIRTFWGALLTKIWWYGHKDILVDWAEGAVWVEAAEGAEGLRRL